MDDADDLNSSELEFEAPSEIKQANYRGQASIDMIIRDAQADRLTSKRAVKQLQFGHGAPGTQAIQSLWVRRFNTYREHTLKQSLDTPFTGDDMLRFFDSIIGTLRFAFLRHGNAPLRIDAVDSLWETGSCPVWFDPDEAVALANTYVSSGKVKPIGINKPAPNADCLTGAFKVLLSYGEFTLDDFKLE